MMRFLHGLNGVSRIYLPTNGLVLADAERSRRLAEFADKLMVLLQFDSGETRRTGRCAPPTRARRATACSGTVRLGRLHAVDDDRHARA
jgi:hypothetical protein